MDRDLLTYLYFVIGGVMLENISLQLYRLVFKKKLRTHGFSIGRYLYLLLFPLIGTLIIINNLGLSILSIFVVFAIIGPVLEWLIGFSYYNIVGKRLWAYQAFSINKHTSILTIPLWGFAGVLFFLITKQIY